MNARVRQLRILHWFGVSLALTILIAAFAVFHVLT